MQGRSAGEELESMIPMDPVHLGIFHDFTFGLLSHFPPSIQAPDGSADPNFGVSVQGQELESMIPVDPFHLGIFHDFMIGAWIRLLQEIRQRELCEDLSWLFLFPSTFFLSSLFWLLATQRKEKLGQEVRRKRNLGQSGKKNPTRQMKKEWISLGFEAFL